MSNLASLAGKESLPQLAAYSAASAGIISFTKALAREVVANNIFVNCIAPGPIATDMIHGLGVPVVDRMIMDSPTKRLGSRGELRILSPGFAPTRAGSTPALYSTCRGDVPAIERYRF